MASLESALPFWSFSYFFWQLTNTAEHALVLCRLLMAGAIFIPVTQLHHVLYLTNDSVRLRTILRSTYLVGGFFFLVNLTPYFVAGVKPTNYFPFWPQPGPLFHVFLAWWAAVAFYACYLLFLAFQKERGIRKKQFYYLVIASGVAYIGGATNFPLWYGIEIPPYGTICFTFYVAIIAYTLLRYHLMDFSVFVEKGLSYLAVLFLISQPAYPVLLLAQKSVFGTISYRYSMVQLFVHLLTVAGAYQMRLGTRRAIAHSILKGQDASLKTLSQFSTNISTLHDMNSLGKEIVESLSKGTQAQTAILFVLDKKKNQYVHVSDFGKFNDCPLDFTFGVTDALPRYLAILQTRVLCRELRQSFPDQWKQSVLKDLEKLQSDACFPFIQKNQLLGFCMVSPYEQKPTEMEEASGFVSTLVREAALALENTLLREEVIRSQTVVRQIDRLRSLETMSLSLAQELAKPQTSIKAFVQLAHMRKNDEEFVQRLKAVLSEDVQRIEQLTKEIRDYVSDESIHRHARENLNELLASCLSFISRNPRFQHIHIDRKLEPAIPSMTLNKQEMRHAIFNVLLFHLNLVDSHNTCLFVATRVIRSATNDQWVQLEISNRQDAPTLEVLLPSIVSPDANYLDLEHCSHTDDGVCIAQDIIQKYGGYIKGYGTNPNIILSLMSLPTKKNIKGSSIPVALRSTAHHHE